jgi:cystathionine gamma-synthase
MAGKSSKPPARHRPETMAARALGWLDAGGGVVPPIHPSTTYARAPDYTLIGGRSYSRDDSAAYAQPEALLAALEGGAGAMLFASGMAATAAAFQALQPGDHVVVQRDLYYGLPKWLKGWAEPWGVKPSFVPTGNIEAIENAVRKGKTKLVWIETPANPTWTVTDIEAAAKIAHGAGARLAVDSTAATPVLTRPIEHGADIVMHSATKFLNGHSDVIAGALVTARDDDYWKRVRYVRQLGGAVLGPFESWLLLRGMRTLHLRVRQQSENALLIAMRLRRHKKLKAVCYPGLSGQPGFEVAQRQMRGGFGGMMSLRFAGGPKAALKFAARLKVFVRATSLGGVESLVEHRGSVEGPESSVPHDLLRVSVGIEHVDDLIADLEQAFAGI